MSITLHGLNISPPVRAVRLVCEALDVHYDMKEVNLLSGDHLTPEYIKMNPLHTVPTIQDGDFILYDSHAIATYLAEKYGKDSWYPKDIKKRAIVNQRLHFNNGILFTRIRDLLEPVIFKGDSTFNPVSVKRLEDALEMLAKLIGDNQWVTEGGPTIADCCCVSTVSSIVNILPSSPLPAAVAAWLARCEKTLPGYASVNKDGAEGLGAFVQSKINK